MFRALCFFSLASCGATVACQGNPSGGGTTSSPSGVTATSQPGGDVSAQTGSTGLSSMTSSPVGSGTTRPAVAPMQQSSSTADVNSMSAPSDELHPSPSSAVSTSGPIQPSDVGQGTSAGGAAGTTEQLDAGVGDEGGAPGDLSGAGGGITAPPVDTARERRVWIAGDSTVANGNTPCPTGWGKHFGELFDDKITVVNSAAGGRSVRTWMYQVQTQMGDDGECLLNRDGTGEPLLQDRWQAMLDEMAEGDTLLIQFGINDGAATCDRHVGLDAFKESYGVLAAAAKARGTQPVFITPVSAIACNGDVPRGTRGGFVDATIEAGDEFDVPVVDLHALSVERYTELGFCPIPGGDVTARTDGDVGEYFCDDHTHFSPSGARDMAQIMAEAVAALELPLAAYLLSSAGEAP